MSEYRDYVIFFLDILGFKEIIDNNKITVDEMLKKFDKAIISEKDKIIPALNQQNWWQMQNVQIIKLENAPHYIFNLYNNWSDLI